MKSNDALTEVADRLHSLAIHLLRTVRLADAESGLSAPRLSALSVVVFGGPLTIGQLADTEQVTAPTMTRLVQGLEADGLLRRTQDPTDGRATVISATAKGTRVLTAGRARRVAMVQELIYDLSARELTTVLETVTLLEKKVAVARAKNITRSTRPPTGAAPDTP